MTQHPHLRPSNGHRPPASITEDVLLDTAASYSGAVPMPVRFHFAQVPMALPDADGSGVTMTHLIRLAVMRASGVEFLWLTHEQAHELSMGLATASGNARAGAAGIILP